ncbi:efflux RND transporter periplasmic adaptor subunit [Novosphingobium bradum]|uniref:Efflux RND transporter periplasmic adaptor subunit n=1 Tax=Novosphingobium bradum TaxID=1737444 RepID=A0ABV7IPB6_9SPHN
MADAAVSEPIAASADSSADEAAFRRAAARRLWLTRLAIAIAVVGALWTGWYLLFGRNHVGTDNAYVSAEMAQVTPQISATVTEVRVSDTQPVKRGDVLVVLDPATPQIALAQAEADLAAARRRFRQAEASAGAASAQVGASDADIARARAQVSSAQADFDKARTDWTRRQALAASGAVSGEELTTARRAFESAQAAVAQARAGLDQAIAAQRAAQGQYQASVAVVAGSTEDTDPAVRAAIARVQQARLDVNNTVIRAPMDGVVTQRKVQVGQRVAQGASIMTIVPVGQLYIDANFKERQLRRVRVGMPATVTADIYGGDVVYHGRVAGISGGTGSSMALIPAQNATGNWIKVVQRLPVRIALDPRELAAHPLRVGLSTEVEIDISSN